MSKDLWMAEHEQIGEEYASGAIDREEAEARLQSLGFDRGEAADQLDALDEDRNNE
jgi:hypothetical protein